MNFYIFIFVAFISGCASGPSLHTIGDPAHRFVQSGYSLVPTNEDDWVLAARSPYQLVLAKMGEQIDETFAIQATLIDLPELSTKEGIVEIVRQAQKANTDPNRFIAQKHEVSYVEISESPCGRSHMLASDNAAVKRSNSSEDMLLEMVTLICRHPKDSKIGISVTYSQRFYQKAKTPGFLEKANAVLNGVKFEAL